MVYCDSNHQRRECLWSTAMATTYLNRSTLPGLEDENNKWTVPYIENFIRASIIGDSTTWSMDYKSTFTSHFAVLRRQPWRRKSLLLPPALYLTNAAVLLVVTLPPHRKLQIPITRYATSSEISNSTQTEDLRQRMTCSNLSSPPG